MKKFCNISALINSISDIEWNSAIFCDFVIWSTNPENCELIVLEGDSELEDLGDVKNHIPKMAILHGVRQLLDAETLRDVIEFQTDLNNESSIKDYIHAIDYYREFDDFFDQESD